MLMFSLNCQDQRLNVRRLFSSFETKFELIKINFSVISKLKEREREREREGGRDRERERERGRVRQRERERKL